MKFLITSLAFASLTAMANVCHVELTRNNGEYVDTFTVQNDSIQCREALKQCNRERMRSGIRDNGSCSQVDYPRNDYGRGDYGRGDHGDHGRGDYGRAPVIMKGDEVVLFTGSRNYLAKVLDMTRSSIRLKYNVNGASEWRTDIGNIYPLVHSMNGLTVNEQLIVRAGNKRYDATIIKIAFKADGIKNILVKYHINGASEWRSESELEQFTDGRNVHFSVGTKVALYQSSNVYEAKVLAVTASAIKVKYDINGASEWREDIHNIFRLRERLGQLYVGQRVVVNASGRRYYAKILVLTNKPNGKDNVKVRYEVNGASEWRNDNEIEILGY